MWLFPASDQSRCIADVQQLALPRAGDCCLCGPDRRDIRRFHAYLHPFRVIGTWQDSSQDSGTSVLVGRGAHVLAVSSAGLRASVSRGRRVNGTTLELIDAQGQAISERKDISIGILTLPSFRVFSTRPSECPSMYGL